MTERERQQAYDAGWDAAIRKVLELSKGWFYHTGSESPPYHLPCISNDRRAYLEKLLKVQVK